MLRTVAAKLAAIALASAALVALFALTAVLLTGYVSSQADRIAEYNKALSVIADMRANFYELRGAAKLYALGIDRSDNLAVYRSDVATFAQDAKNAASLGLPMVRRDVQVAASHEGRFVQIANQGMRNLQAGRRAAGRRLILVSASRAAATADSDIDVATADAGGAGFVADTARALTATSGVVRIAVTLAGIVIIIFMLVAGILLGRYIASRIRIVSDFMSLVAAGDISREPPRLTGRDETTELADAARRMLVGLRDLIGEAAVASSQMGSAAAQLDASARRSGDAVGQVGASIGTVAEVSGKQAAGVLEAMQAQRQLHAAIEQVARGAQEQAVQASGIANAAQGSVQKVDEMENALADLETAATSAVRSVQGGRRTVDESLEAERAVSEEILLARDRMAELDAQARRIEEVTRLVGEIAEQTNLLALNAAIEAARAGEHGKGFAVVAEEVRTLSDRTKLAVGEIANLVGTVEQSAAAARDAVEGGAQGVKVLQTKGGEVGVAFEEIAGALARAAEVLRLTLAAAHEVEVLSGEIAQSMAGISAIAEENSATAEEMTAAADGVDVIMGQLATGSDETAATAAQVASSQGLLGSALEEVQVAVAALNGSSQRLLASIGTFRLSE